MFSVIICNTDSVSSDFVNKKSIEIVLFETTLVSVTWSSKSGNTNLVFTQKFESTTYYLRCDWEVTCLIWKFSITKSEWLSNANRNYQLDSWFHLVTVRIYGYAYASESLDSLPKLIFFEKSTLRSRSLAVGEPELEFLQEKGGWLIALA